MGVMIDGVYHAEDPAPDSALNGAFERSKSTIRHWISAGPDAEFPAEPGRYHLFVTWNCPWAHRSLLIRLFKGLEHAITLSYAKPRRTPQGWVFDAEGAFSDPLFSASAMHEVYARDVAPYTGRATVPVLWDKIAGRAVSNESADIVRMLNDAFDGPDLAPAPLRDQIETWNTMIYADLNNGVYRAGFARTQEAYDAAVPRVFDALDRIEAQLGQTRYLTGDRFTEADLRLFPTLARFDVGYHTAFKCNIRRLIDYPNLWAYAREIYQMPGVAGTVDFEIYKQGYFSASPLRNPLGIVPLGPKLDWEAPHDRG